MEFFKVMNQKLSDGFKMTDYQCPKCKANALVDEYLSTFYCCKCNQEIYLDDDTELEVCKQKSPSKQQNDTKQLGSSNIANEETDLEYEEYMKQADLVKNDQNYQQKKKDEKQKLQLMGEKLLLGWVMLGSHCENCQIPQMKDKKNQIVCVGCEINKQQDQNQQVQNQQVQNQQFQNQKAQNQNFQNQQVQKQQDYNQQVQNQKVENQQVQNKNEVQKEQQIVQQEQISQNSSLIQQNQQINPQKFQEKKDKIQNKFYDMILLTQEKLYNKLSELNSATDIEQFLSGPFNQLTRAQNSINEMYNEQK